MKVEEGVYIYAACAKSIFFFIFLPHSIEESYKSDWMWIWWWPYNRKHWIIAVPAADGLLWSVRGEDPRNLKLLDLFFFFIFGFSSKDLKNAHNSPHSFDSSFVEVKISKKI